jgi:DNA modification methylase
VTFIFLQGDARQVLKTVPAKIIQTCVTSPPYFGLRDYGTASWEGGSSDCDHLGEPFRTSSSSSINANWGDGFSDVKNKEKRQPMGANCHKCNARRIDAQIGLEQTPQDYVTQLVELFREVRRTLRDDGTLWLNLGDSYAGSWGAQSRGSTSSEARSKLQGSSMLEARTIEAFPLKTNTGSLKNTPGLKPKDLIGIPWRVAFALQAGFATCDTCRREMRSDLWPTWNGHRVCIDCERGGVRGTRIVQTEPGWYLRQDIIWHKPNPMPESVRDRCTKAHEYIFLLSKSEKYFFDAEAIKEPAAYFGLKNQDESGFKDPRSFAGKHKEGYNSAGRPKGNARTFRGGGAYTQRQSFDNSAVVERESVGNVPNKTGMRNRRSVWTIAPKPFKEAHFATFPPDLIRPCILAGAPKSGLVLDPFGGAGTTALVAESELRHSISIELNPAYVEMARSRVAKALDSPPQP